jgi:hypothetical protein
MTRLTTVLSAGLLGAFLVGSSALAQQDVNADYDHSFQFNKIKSYSWAKVQATDPIVEPRITIAIDHILQGEGYHLVDMNKNPSVVISAVDASNNSREYARFYRGMAGYTWKADWTSNGFMDTPASLRRIPVGTLIVDMYTPETKKLVWRGTSTEPVDVKEKTKDDAIDKTVATMFKHFPVSNVPNPVEAHSGIGTGTTGNNP